MPKPLTIATAIALALALAWGVQRSLGAADSAAGGGERKAIPVPVETGPVERGPITLRRQISGTMEAAAELVVASQVAGRLVELAVDLGDVVQRGQVVARLDDAELVQAVHRAEAELAVAEASGAEASSAMEIADRALGRAEALRRDGVTSDAQLDAARSARLAAGAKVQVAVAGAKRAQAALEAARIRLGYAEIAVDWKGGDDERVVAQRFVDEGGSLSANSPLLRVVELDPIVCVLQVPERDYAKLALGQAAMLTTDSYPDREFEGSVTRIAPVFRSSTRQARIELLVNNVGEPLRPGMFARAVLQLDHAADATIVPFAALTERAGQVGVFHVDTEASTVHWLAVETGIREGDRIQVDAPGLTGQVVTLGQDLCDDGGTVHLPEPLVPSSGAGDGETSSQASLQSAR